MKTIAAFLCIALVGIVSLLSGLAWGSSGAANHTLTTFGLTSIALGLVGALFACLQLAGGRRWASAGARTAYLLGALALVGASSATSSWATATARPTNDPPAAALATNPARTATADSVSPASDAAPAVMADIPGMQPVAAAAQSQAAASLATAPPSPAPIGKPTHALDDMGPAPAPSSPAAPASRAPRPAMAMPSSPSGPASTEPMPAMATPPPPSGAAAICDEMESGPHMLMTPAHTPTQADMQRAAQLVAMAKGLRATYANVAAATADGYNYNGPNLGKFNSFLCFHFTSNANAMEAQFTFDPAKPTSLLYAKPNNGPYELVGVMYTAPLNDSAAQVNARVPASVYPWHQHINVCDAPQGYRGPAFGPHALFGLAGSISTASACAQAGGTFLPHLFGWMDHVFPFAS
ncbi:MAG: hypothetical protein ACRDHX_03485 [Chloroflexota bacterium]